MVLSFMAEVLVVGVLGALGWMAQISRQPLQPLHSSQGTSQQPLETEAAPLQPQEPAASPPSPAPDLGTQEANPDQAITRAQKLYAELSSGKMDAVRQLFSPASLRQRQSQITGLATGQLQARQLQRNAATDPLGALLGTAFLAREPQQTPRPLRALGASPELEAALAATWPAGPADRRMGPRPAQAGPTGSSRPTAPPP
ncbi:hypothetical protein [Vulcanococcus limneticus]|uniref:hypothetical protein n=1 Tax=Vulcanococcus limneticus TaxID=2170428 RepID=UPI00398C0425